MRAALEQAGVEIESSEVVQQPSSRVPVEEAEAERLVRLIDAFEENDDVNAVHANFDVDADVLERVAGVAFGLTRQTATRSSASSSGESARVKSSTAIAAARGSS